MAWSSAARSQYAFQTSWEDAVAAARIDNFRFRDLRTFASWAVQRGATLQEVKDLLGTALRLWFRAGRGAWERQTTR